MVYRQRREHGLPTNIRCSFQDQEAVPGHCADPIFDLGRQSTGLEGSVTMNAAQLKTVKNSLAELQRALLDEGEAFKAYVDARKQAFNMRQLELGKLRMAIEMLEQKG